MIVSCRPPATAVDHTSSAIFFFSTPAQAAALSGAPLVALPETATKHTNSLKYKVKQSQAVLLQSLRQCLPRQRCHSSERAGPAGTGPHTPHASNTAGCRSRSGSRRSSCGGGRRRPAAVRPCFVVEEGAGGTFLRPPPGLAARGRLTRGSRTATAAAATQSAVGPASSRLLRGFCACSCVAGGGGMAAAAVAGGAF